MKVQPLAARVGRYGLVGVAAASVHYGILELSGWPLWLSNPIAFLIASLTSYLGHALYTFRDETDGQRFARRWLILQFSVNLSACYLLGLWLNPWGAIPFTKLILVLTPTILNALIWTKAAQFSLQRQRPNKSKPKLHADDLGLTNATNTAILALAKAKQLDSASLLVNGNAVESAVEQCRSHPNLQLCLHLCLSEGRAVTEPQQVSELIDDKGRLKCSFGQLMLASCLPKNAPGRRRLEKQLRCEVNSQIQRFRELTGLTIIAIDGHQHLHLVPIVLDIILELAAEQGICWLRTTAEPLPTGLSWRYWQLALTNGGWLKWLVLQTLTRMALPRLRKALVATNAGFAGVLFTGRMVDSPLRASWQELKSLSFSPPQTEPLLLSHPAAQLKQEESNTGLRDFPLSRIFFTSPWRQLEWQAIKDYKPVSQLKVGHE
ncbi:MAG: ChbG/HpnK family deacetylase [Prochlorococcus sp.]